MEIVIGKPLPRDPDYDDMVKARAFWRASYRAGRKYRNAKDAHGDDILIRHPSEADRDYMDRKRMTTPRGYVGPIIRRYNDFVFRRPPTIPKMAEGSLADQLWQDITGSGTPALKWFTRRLRDAQKDGVAYILVDSTRPAEALSISEAEARQNGYRIICRQIDPESVLSVERDGDLITQALVLLRVDGVRIARLYTATTLTDYSLSKDNVPTDVIGMRNHGYGGIPLVELRPTLDDESESQAAPLSEHQMTIFNLLSLLMQELRDNTFTQWVLAGITKDEAADSGVEYGSNRIFCIPNPGGTLSRIGSDVAQADSLRRSIDAEIDALYRTAGVDGGSPTQAGAPESGLAKAFKFNDLNANLAAMGDAVESAINQVFRIAHQATGQEYPGDIKFPDEHAPPDYGAELQELISALATNAIPPVIRRVVADRFIQRNLNLSNEDVESWEMEREQIGQSPISLGHGMGLGEPAS